jgi:spore coat protein U-like protein
LSFCWVASVVAGIMLSLCLGSGSAEAACTLSVTPAAFGTYNVFASSPTDTTATIQVRCTGLFDWLLTVDVDLSKGQSGSFNPRTLKSGSNTLNYNLYMDAARTTIWGDGTGGTSHWTVSNPSVGTWYSQTAYGRIPANQDPVIGSYTDTIVVTANW